MKRLVIVLVGLVVLGAAATSASARSSAALTLTGPATVQAGSDFTLSGTLSGVRHLSGQSIYIAVSYGFGCEEGAPPAQSGAKPQDSWVTTDGSGNYQQVLSTVTADIGQWSFRAFYYKGEDEEPAAMSNCLDVDITAAAVAAVQPPPPNNVFLCYSVFETNPAVFPIGTAGALLGHGYWSPYAVPGNVAGGTNIGGYNLVCNLASAQSVGDSTLGGAGEVYGAGVKQELEDVPGHYSVVG